MVIVEKGEVTDAIQRLKDLEALGMLCPSCVKVRIVFDEFGESGDITWVPKAKQDFEDAGYPCGIN
jgi:hypothetical protein